MELENKIALVTGGTTGIGRATAVALAKNKAKVVIFGRHQQTLNDALSDIKRLTGNGALGLIADSSKYEDIIRVFNFINKTFGKLDILINNAGQPARSILDTDPVQIKYVIETNISGYLFCAKLAGEMMLKDRGGHIVNIGSLSGYTRDADSDLYTATKSAIIGFNESFRKKVSHKCIKVSIINPGAVGTNLINESVELQQEKEQEELILKAEDVAEAVLFCLNQPRRCEILEIQLRAHRQII